MNKAVILRSLLRSKYQIRMFKQTCCCTTGDGLYYKPRTRYGDRGAHPFRCDWEPYIGIVYFHCSGIYLTCTWLWNVPYPYTVSQFAVWMARMFLFVSLIISLGTCVGILRGGFAETSLNPNPLHGFWTCSANTMWPVDLSMKHWFIILLLQFYGWFLWLFIAVVV